MLLFLLFLKLYLLYKTYHCLLYSFDEPHLFYCSHYLKLEFDIILIKVMLKPSELRHFYILLQLIVLKLLNQVVLKLVSKLGISKPALDTYQLSQTSFFSC